MECRIMALFLFVIGSQGSYFMWQENPLRIREASEALQAYIKCKEAGQRGKSCRVGAKAAEKCFVDLKPKMSFMTDDVYQNRLKAIQEAAHVHKECVQWSQKDKHILQDLIKFHKCMIHSEFPEITDLEERCEEGTASKQMCLDDLFEDKHIHMMSEEEYEDEMKEYQKDKARCKVWAEEKLKWDTEEGQRSIEECKGKEAEFGNIVDPIELCVRNVSVPVMCMERLKDEGLLYFMPDEEFLERVGKHENVSIKEKCKQLLLNRSRSEVLQIYDWDKGMRGCLRHYRKHEESERACQEATKLRECMTVVGFAHNMTLDLRHSTFMRKVRKNRAIKCAACVGPTTTLWMLAILSITVSLKSWLQL